MPPDIKQIFESIEEEGEFAEPGFTFFYSESQQTGAKNCAKI